MRLFSPHEPNYRANRDHAQHVKLRPGTLAVLGRQTKHLFRQFPADWQRANRLQDSRSFGLRSVETQNLHISMGTITLSPAYKRSAKRYLTAGRGKSNSLGQGLRRILLPTEHR